MAQLLPVAILFFRFLSSSPVHFALPDCTWQPLAPLLAGEGKTGLSLVWRCLAPAAV